MITEKKISIQNTDFYYTIQGNGFPVILIHGFGENGSIWKNQAAYLSNKFKIITPHLPGSGPSPINNTSSLSIDSLAEYVKILLDAEDIVACVVMGHSMGGYIALAMAEKYPKLIMGLGLIHSSAYADTTEKIQNRKKSIEFIKQNGAMAFLKTAIPSLFYNTQKKEHQIASLINTPFPFSAEALIGYYEAMIDRPDRTHVLINSNIPILLILGKHDQTIPIQLALQQSFLAETTELHILRESAHMGMLEETNRCNLIFGSFLASPAIPKN